MKKTILSLLISVFLSSALLCAEAGRAGGAEFPPPPKGGGLLGLVKFVKEDPDWSVYHFRDNGLYREVRFILNNIKREDAVFAWRTSLDGKRLMAAELPKNDLSRSRVVVEVPVVRDEQLIELTVRVGDKVYFLDSDSFVEPSPRAEVHVEADPKVNPVDAGRFLEPSNEIIAQEGGVVRFRWRIAFLDKEARGATVVYRISSGGATQERTETIAGEPGSYVSAVHTLGPLKTGAGTYSLDVELRCGGEIAAKYHYGLHVVAKPQAKPFGAYYTSLRYDGDVHIFDADGDLQRVPWDDAWRMGSVSDVVVHFPQGFDYVFWRGASFIPMWAIGNVAMTYEWVEAPGNADGAHDCVEPLQDKECRYSNVRIISSTPARVVVHWRYAESDMDYKIIKDEWVDEYYTLYPDGYGARKVVGWLESFRWHETNEMINILPAGRQPFDALPPNALSVYDTAGARMDVTWPEPEFDWKFRQPTLFRIHFLDSGVTPVMATRNLMSVQKLYDGWDRDGRYVSPSYWGDHWPLTRNKATTRYVPPGWRERPAHASLVALVHKPLETIPVGANRERTTWGFFIGATDASDNDFVRAADSWVAPPDVAVVAGASLAAYDAGQRAYVVTAQPGAKRVAVRITPEKEGRVVHPAFVLAGFAPDKVSVKANGKPLKSDTLRYGVEDSLVAPQGVLFINATFDGETTFEISAVK